VSAARDRGPAEIGREVLRTESRALEDLIPRIGEAFERAVEILHGCAGRVVVTGMGKSGIVGKKIAATLSSTGTPAVFLHPAEAVHGDLGMVVAGDVVLALSHSGETDEILRLLETMRRIGSPLLAMTGAIDSTLARHADVVIDVGISREACPLDLAPTASTTAQLAMGDALAMAVMSRRGFTAEEFAARHPGGSLGRRILRVEAVMHTGDRLPAVRPEAPMREVVARISDKGLGAAVVVDGAGRLRGLITDGDLRRRMQRHERPMEGTAADAMTADPACIGPGELAVVALRMMEERRITSLPVVDPDRRLVGFLHLHQLWKIQMF
jgi:arabinose-5-phosphate isomerase